MQGRTERELPALFEGTNMRSHVFRPGYFFPSKDYPEDRLNQRGAVARALDIVTSPIYALAPSFYTPIDDFGKFAMELVKGRWPQQELFRNAEMRKLMKTLSSGSYI